MTLTLDEIEALRIAIAEECGWKRVDVYEWDGDIRKPKQWADFDVLPPYTSSLDAIQAAAVERFKSDDDKDALHTSLKESQEHDGLTHIWQLTALDWCIAFARTAKIWRYKL